MKEPLFYVSLAQKHTFTHGLCPHLGLTVWQSEMLAWWSAGEGGQGRKGSQVPQTSIKLTGTPALKLSDPTPKNPVSLLFSGDTQTLWSTHTQKCTNTELPGLKKQPRSKVDQLTVIRTFCGHEIILKISSRKQEKGDRVLKKETGEVEKGKKVFWMSSTGKLKDHMCWQGEKWNNLDLSQIMTTVKITN